MNCLNSIDRMTIQPEQLKDIIKLYQYKGKDFYYQDVLKKDINSISKETIIKECYAVSKYLKLNITESRQKSIVKNNSAPKTNDEKIFANIKTIFTTFNERISNFDIIANQFLRLGERLFLGVKKIKFNTVTKTVKYNLLDEKQKTSKREILENLISKYTQLLRSNNYEIVALVTSFYIDFINLDIFNEENEIIGLFIMYSLLYREGFNLFKYVCFFDIFLKYEAEFKNKALLASYHWNEGYPNASELTKLVISMLNEGYTQVDNMIRSIEIIGDNNKTDVIESTIYKRMPNIFTKEMIMNCHPNVSPSTIDRTLKRLRDENIIRANGQGRSATWSKLVETEQFDSSVKQISLFDELDNI
ncbi:MAG: hypothetical protein ACI35W_04645 [Anaeroplasmataceae bacterium]